VASFGNPLQTPLHYLLTKVFRSCGRDFRQLLREWKLVDKRLVAVFFLFDTPHDFRAISAG
jgi:hypothetical protein